jgi:hypothetical protein
MKVAAHPREGRGICGVTSLIGIALVVAIIWAIVLPRVGDLPTLRASIDRREALGINAEAMFYTELEAMETLRVRWDVERVRGERRL